MSTKRMEQLTLILLVIAGILWGLIGLFDFDLMPYLAEPNWFIRVVYFIFGVAGIYALVNWKAMKKYSGK